MKKCCIDMRLPTLLEHFPMPASEFGIAPIRKLWTRGTVLRVRFLGGTPSDHTFVEQVASQWMQFANLKFEFNNARNAEIRISFNPDIGSWSMVGTDALRIRRNEATMNFAWLDEAVVLHEFGHAIGLGHEHQNPVGGIQWDKERVYADLAQAPNFWDRSTVDHNMFGRYAEDQIQATELDPASIMMYPIPNEWTLNDFEVGFNPAISDLDKAFVGQLYPFDAPTNELPINEIVKEQASIGRAGEEDAYQFEVETEGVYTIQTEGNTDVFMSLFGPDSRTRLLAEDDDSGASRNAKITKRLLPGRYFVQVRHFSQESGTGQYAVYILKETPLLG